MPTYPRTCSCDRCYQLEPDARWDDSEHPDSDAVLDYCPQCGQGLTDHPTYSARREEGLPQ